MFLLPEIKELDQKQQGNSGNTTFPIIRLWGVVHVFITCSFKMDRINCNREKVKSSILDTLEVEHFKGFGHILRSNYYEINP